MHRAHKFLKDSRDHILHVMDAHTGQWKAHEMDYIEGMCDLHNSVCEFLAWIEKEDVKPTHDSMLGKSMFERK